MKTISHIKENYLLILGFDLSEVNDLEKTLRLSKPPVITRILENKVLIDLRTVSENEEIELLEILAKSN